MKFLFFIFLLPCFAWAQTPPPRMDPFNLTEEEISPSTEEVLIKKPEKYLRNESMIYDFNTERGIKDQRRYTGTDENRLSLAGHVNGAYEHVSDLLGIEVNYMRRSKRYNQVWWGAQFFRHATYFDAITTNHAAATGAGSTEGNYQRPGGTKNTVMAAGLGASYRFKLLLDFVETEDWFESVDVFANYVTLNESFINKNYQGYGLSTNYGLHKRSSNSFFYGGKFAYNIASVTRAAMNGESKRDRSLTLGWLSLAFEIGVFF
jgi:hypothetical protein